MVVATVVLFYVSYWLLSKMEVVKWNHFVKSKVQDALDSGSALALATAAFLAVYREGFETVLFYKALFVSGDGRRRDAGGRRDPGGSVVLVGVYIAHQPLRRPAAAQAVLRRDERVPLLHGVRLRGEGRRGAAGGRADQHDDRRRGRRGFPRWASTRPRSRSAPRACWSCSRSLALVWNFVLEPRRLRGVTSVMVPEPRPAAACGCRDSPVPRPDAGRCTSLRARSSSCFARSSAWRPIWPRCGPKSSGCGATWSRVGRPRPAAAAVIALRHRRSLRRVRRRGARRRAAVPRLGRRRPTSPGRSKPCEYSRTTRWSGRRSRRRGAGRVLVVDGGGSLRTALLGGNLAALAQRQRLERGRGVRLHPGLR